MVDYDRDQPQTRDGIHDPSATQFRVGAPCTACELVHVERKASPRMPPHLVQNFFGLNYPKWSYSVYYHSENYLKAFQTLDRNETYYLFECFGCNGGVILKI